jgi:lysozyme
MLKMRDVSSWQGSLSEEDIKNLDAEILAVKFTEGTGYLSPVSQSDWHNAKAAGKVRIAYHYFHPSVSVTGQVRYFLDNVKTAGLENGDMLALDHEETDGLSASEVAAAARAFVSAVNEEVKGSCIVYTYLSFAGLGNCDGLGDTPLWIADPSRPAGNPTVPAPWKLWSFQQYGITKGTDDDIANFENVDQMSKLGVFVETPVPTADQRTVKLTVSAHLIEKGSSVERLVNVENLISGFKIETGNATFEIL